MNRLRVLAMRVLKRVCVFVYAIMDKKSKVGSERNRIKKLNRFSFRWAFFKSFVIVFLYSLHFVSLFQCARALSLSLPFVHTHIHPLSLLPTSTLIPSLSIFLVLRYFFPMPILLLFALKQHEWQQQKNRTNIVYLALCSNVWQALFLTASTCAVMCMCFFHSNIFHLCILLFVACVCVFSSFTSSSSSKNNNKRAFPPHPIQSVSQPFSRSCMLVTHFHFFSRLTIAIILGFSNKVVVIIQVSMYFVYSAVHSKKAKTIGLLPSLAVIKISFMSLRVEKPNE